MNKRRLVSTDFYIESLIAKKIAIAGINYDGRPIVFVLSKICTCDLLGSD